MEFLRKRAGRRAVGGQKTQAPQAAEEGLRASLQMMREPEA